MSLLVKVCGNTCSENISSIVSSAFAPDYLGFILSEKSPRGISPLLLKKLLRSLSSHVKTVLVVVESDIKELKHLLMTLEEASPNLSAMQFHGNQDREFLLSCKEFFSGDFIKVFSVSEDFDFSLCEEFKDIADYFLFDTGGVSTTLGGSGTPFNWNLLEGYKSSIPYILAGGITPKDVAKLKQLSVSQPLLYAVDINSRFEISPGIKDPASVSNFIKEIRS